MVDPRERILMAQRKSWIVQARKQKLPLKLGDGEEWIEVKDRLTVGEHRDLADKAMGDAIPDMDNPDNAFAMKAEMKMANYPINRALVWVTDWSLVDHEGKTVPVNRVNMRALETEAFDAIDKCLDVHIGGMEKAGKANPTKAAIAETGVLEQPSSIAPLSAVTSSKS